jgi:hypothetical protein
MEMPRKAKPAGTFDAGAAAGDTPNRPAQAPGRDLREGKGVNRASIRSHLLLLVLAVSIPLVVAGLIAIHFWRVRKDGGISQPL